MPKKKPTVRRSENAEAGGGPNRTGAPQRAPKKPPLTDAERHQRFVEMAREVEASEDASDFEEAFKIVTTPAPNH